MFENVLSNIVAGIITSGGAWALHKLWNHIKNASPASDTLPTHYPRKTVKLQFYICMVTTPLFYGFALTSSADNRFLWYVFTFISMFLEWCAFGAAFDFYPADDPIDVPTDGNADNKPN